MLKQKKFQQWLFITVFVLFILQILLLPVFIGVTYPTRSSKPEHIITYSNYCLIWDKSTQVDSEGMVRLNIFDSKYENIQSDNGDKIIAPGEAKESIIRFQNTAKNKISYTAVLYEINEKDLPLEVMLSGNNFTDATSVPMAGSDDNMEIVRAVKGEVLAGQMQEFDISWFWAFEDSHNSEFQDVVDTGLGNEAAVGEAQDVTLGFYIVVSDEDRVITPDSPETGDPWQLELYILLMFISATILVALTVERKRHYD